MSNFSGMHYTTQGKNLLAKGQIGTPIHFTKVVLGDGVLPINQNIGELQTLINHKKDVNIHSLTALGDGTSQVRFILTNEGWTDGLFVREIGLMAQDPDHGEILYSYTNCGDTADFIPAGGGATVIENQIDLITVVGNAANVTAEVGSVILALKEDLTGHNDDPNAHSGSLHAISDAMALFKLFEPHKVQLELFSPKWTIYTAATWDVDQAAGRAVAQDGGTYEATNLEIIDKLSQDKAVVIRRTDNDAVLNVFFKDSTHPAWTPAPWVWRRPQAGGLVDVEYKIPARGAFDIRVECALGGSAVKPIIELIAFVECETCLGGTHRPPATPAIVSPADAATGITEQPSLTTGAFSHPAGDALGGSRFQISTAADFAEANIVVDSGIAPGVSWFPDKGVLSVNTVYHVRALHVDENGGISEWSAPVNFTTAATFITVDKPTCISPAASDELGTPDGLTLVSSAFAATGGGDTHKSSQWQLATDTAFSTIIHDSGVDAVNLTSYNAPGGTVARGNTYYWRVRHEGATGGWSDWSVATVFNVSVVPPVEDVFATKLYTGNGGSQNIVNGIDLAEKVGLVWVKNRYTTSFDHALYDTMRGPNKRLSTNDTYSEQTDASGVTAFKADGFSIGNYGFVNSNGKKYASWTFRKAPKFFDIVTWTGDGQAGRKIPHALGCVPGMITVRPIDAASHWYTYHKAIGAGKVLLLNDQDIARTYNHFSQVPTSDDFTVSAESGSINLLGVKYVAYLFAHDPSPEGLIQCGKYTGGSGTKKVNLGWEPQYLMVKRISGGTSVWIVMDITRDDWPLNALRAPKALFINSSTMEMNSKSYSFVREATGFSAAQDAAGNWNVPGNDYIYMAIRATQA